MEKTISKGDHVVVDTHYYRSHAPKRQDVVVFLRDGTFFVKRVMAAGGDTIEGRKGLILVNGNAILEPYIQHIGEPPPYLNTFGPITVPAGEYFVMGDNRDVSFDSRSPEFGYLHATSIVGKSLYIFGSDRIGESIR
jgi:signal peptidase I